MCQLFGCHWALQNCKMFRNREFFSHWEKWTKTKPIRNDDECEWILFQVNRESVIWVNKNVYLYCFCFVVWVQICRKLFQMECEIPRLTNWHTPNLALRFIVRDPKTNWSVCELKIDLQVWFVCESYSVTWIGYLNKKLWSDYTTRAQSRVNFKFMYVSRELQFRVKQVLEIYNTRANHSDWIMPNRVQWTQRIANAEKERKRKRYRASESSVFANETGN